MICINLYLDLVESCQMNWGVRCINVPSAEAQTYTAGKSKLSTAWASLGCPEKKCVVSVESETSRQFINQLAMMSERSGYGLVSFLWLA